MKKSKLLILLFIGIQFWSYGQKTIGDLSIVESVEYKEKEKTDNVLSFNTSKSEKTVVLRKNLLLMF